MEHESILEKILSSSLLLKMVIVPKADGDIPFCLDSCSINYAIIPGGYPLSSVDELSKLFAAPKKFSKLDLKAAYGR